MSVDGALVEEVRERLAREAAEVTPHRVAEALRASGRPVGDATVLAVHEALRRDVVGAGPLEPLRQLFSPLFGNSGDPTVHARRDPDYFWGSRPN